MREHALPQDVTGYKFHIIGNMTLKQFAEVGAGCVVAFLLYQTNLYPMIKYPLMVLAAGAGAMIAFVPIEERPLDQWITAFFRALYRPTQYYWKRTVKIPEPFLYQARTEVKTLVADVDLTPARRQRVKEYLHSIDQTSAPADQLDQYTDQRLDEVMGVFGTQTVTLTATTSSVAEVETAELLAAQPDTVAETVAQLSFTGRATEEVAMDTPTSSAAELAMENDVLNLFAAVPTPTPVETAPPEESVPVVVPAVTFPPELPTPELPEPALPSPTEEAPLPDQVPAQVSFSLPERPETPPATSTTTPPVEPVPEPAATPTATITPAPQPAPSPAVPPISKSGVEPPPAKDVTPPRTSPPTAARQLAPAQPSTPSTAPIPVQLPQIETDPQQLNRSQLTIPQTAAEVPADLTELPTVALEAEEVAPSELPQISTIFDHPNPTGEQLPNISVAPTAKYAQAAATPSLDASQVANIADVIAQAATSDDRHKTKAKGRVTFKKIRPDSDRFETVLPHIIDMSGSSQTIISQPTAAPADPQNTTLPKAVVVPEVHDVRIEKTVGETTATTATTDATIDNPAFDPSLLELPSATEAVPTATESVTFNTNLPFPEKPTTANKVVGMVLDQNSTPLPNAIVEILTSDGLTARAVKTNALGQFFIATPLAAGNYFISADREGYQFATKQLNVTDTVIDPIEIRAV